MRTTRGLLKQYVDSINHLYGLRLELNKIESGYRVMDRRGSRDISPRLSAREMWAWLNGFWDALYYTRIIGEEDDERLLKSSKVREGV
jgi:hypothetical protein